MDIKKIASQSMTKLGMAVGATLVAVSANAATFTWDFQNTASLPTPSFIETSLAGGQTITMSAFTATSSTSTWTTANFTNQAGAGLGISHSGEPTGAPQHAIDSINNQDVVVVDAGAGKTFDWTTLRIGYGEDRDTYNSNTLISSSQADIRVWARNDLGSNTISSLGAAALMNNVPINTNANIDGTSAGNLAPSRYLVISGNINDAFKLQQLGANAGSPPNQTPEPGSIALLGLGLLGFGLARRRRKVA